MSRGLFCTAALLWIAVVVTAPPTDAFVATFPRRSSQSGGGHHQKQLSSQQQTDIRPSSTTTSRCLVKDSRLIESFVLLRQLQKQHGQRMSSTDEDDGGWTPTKSAMIGGAGVNNAGEPPFEIRGFSLGNLVIVAGLLITVLSFAEYLGDNSETLSVSGLGFVYGIPVFLAGAALKYAEIDPVPVVTNIDAEAAYEKMATETIKKIKQDVTRHRYGDEAHLDTTVKKLGLVVPGKAYPQLLELRQDVVKEGGADDGKLSFMMVWQSIDTPYKMWADERRIKKYETFFGPNVKADVVKIDSEQRMVGIRLITDGTTSSSSGGAPVAEEVASTTAA